MKKVFLITALLTLFSAGVFAKSDIQLRVEPCYVFDSANLAVFPVSIGQYNFFGEDQRFGFGENIDIGILNLADYGGSIMVGPAFGVNLGKKKRTRLQAITGFQYSFSETYKNTKTIKNKETEYSFVDSYKCHGYTLLTDVQFKFTSDLRCSFVFGGKFGFGVCRFILKQTVTSSDSNITFIPQTKERNDSSESFAFPYIALAINF